LKFPVPPAFSSPFTAHHACARALPLARRCLSARRRCRHTPGLRPVARPSQATSTQHQVSVLSLSSVLPSCRAQPPSTRNQA
jgi:hypothetical protein